MERYCTACGRITRKAHDSLYICEIGHENWLNPALGAVVYVIRNDTVLYGVRSIEPHIGKLSLPGGFVEIGESAEETAIRETKEELGIDIAIHSYLGTYVSSYDGRPTLTIVFIAKSTEQDTITGDDMKGGEPVWRPISSLPTQDETAWDWYQEAEKDLLKWVETHKV